MVKGLVVAVLALAVSAYADVTFVLNTSTCRPTLFTAEVSANWIDPTHTCSKSYDNLFGFTDGNGFYGARCQGNEAASIQRNHGGRDDCYCVTTSTVGQGAGDTSIVLDADCSTLVSRYYWDYDQCF